MLPDVKQLLVIRHRFRRWISWLWRQEGTPGQRARGIGAGIFSGCFPLFGLQTIMGITLARILRGNSLLAAGGTWISNPITYVPLYWFNYQVGSWLLKNEQLEHNLNGLTLEEIFNQSWEFTSRVLLGSTIVGMIAGILSGSIIYGILKRFPIKKGI